MLITFKVLLTCIQLDIGAAVCLLDTSIWNQVKGLAKLSPWVEGDAGQENNSTLKEPLGISCHSC